MCKKKMKERENKKIIKMFLEILNCEDFGLVRYKNGVWSLRDFQCANLGGICDETYNTIEEVIDRMSIYHEDYFEEDLMELFGIDEHEGFLDLAKKCKKNKKLYKENKWEVDTLEFITTATDYEICNTPLENIKELLTYEQYENDFIEDEGIGENED